jgi:hypothetical protein
MRLKKRALVLLVIFFGMILINKSTYIYAQEFDSVPDVEVSAPLHS